MLITGASSGIGECIARLAATKGYDLILTARSSAKLEALASELSTAHGVDCQAITSDLSKPGGAAALHAACASRNLAVDILVNNAGVGLFGAALEQKPQDFLNMIQLNVSSLTELCVLFGRDMAQAALKAGRKRYRILNIASMVGLMPVPYFSTYAATKAYVRSYSASLRAELARRGVGVSCVLPGYVATNFDAASQATDKAYRSMSERMGMSPQRVARVALASVERNRAHVIPGLGNSIGAFFITFFPKNILAAITNSFLSGMLGKKAT